MVKRGILETKELPVAQRVKLLVDALDGAENTNEALSNFDSSFCITCETMGLSSTRML